MPARRFDTAILSIFLCLLLACSREQNIQQYLGEKITTLEEKYSLHKSEEEFSIKEGKEKLEDARLCLENHLLLAGLYLADIAETYLDIGRKIRIARKNEKNTGWGSNYWNEKKPEIENLLREYAEQRDSQKNTFLRSLAAVYAFQAEKYFESGKSWLDLKNPISGTLYTSRGILYASRAVNYSRLSSRRDGKLEIDLDILKKEYEKFHRLLVNEYSDILQTENKLGDYLSPDAKISLGERFIEKNIPHSALLELLLANELYYQVKTPGSTSTPDPETYERIKAEMENRLEDEKNQDHSIAEFFRQMGEYYFIQYQRNQQKDEEYLRRASIIFQKVLPLYFRIVTPRKIVITLVRWPFR